MQSESQWRTQTSSETGCCGIGRSESGCGESGCNQTSCSETRCSEIPCSEIGCGETGCEEIGYSEIVCRESGCNASGCEETGCKETGYSETPYGEIGCGTWSSSRPGIGCGVAAWGCGSAVRSRRPRPCCVALHGGCEAGPGGHSAPPAPAARVRPAPPRPWRPRRLPHLAGRGSGRRRSPGAPWCAAPAGCTRRPRGRISRTLASGCRERCGRSGCPPSG